MNNSVVVGGNQMPAYIDKLCDVVPNLKRPEEDFKSLLSCIENSPKDCIPFKGKILQHIQAHALENPGTNIRLLASCFAKATILFRKTPNKSEGSLGAWKTGLLAELRNLDKNLNELFKVVGVNTNKIIGDDNLTEDDELKSQEKLSESKADFKTIINDYLLKVNWSAHNICALICMKVDFDLPIPAHVLIKMASKISSLRWKDYKKKPVGLLRIHVYSLTPHLIDISLMLYQSLVKVLGSNIIPYTPFINQSILRVLEWTRTSNLLRHDERLYHSIRLQIFKNFSFMAEQLSLNLNLDPLLLKTLLEVELVDNLNELTQLVGSSENTLLRNKHIFEALSCLEKLFVIYAQYLEASLEGSIKSYVIQTCIKIYRNYDSSVINLECRRQLLNFLQIIANQPYATSTTEIAYHIFELAWKFESDSDMRSLARNCLKVGLAHRPTIVAHYDIYNVYNQPMELVGKTQTDNQVHEEALPENGDDGLQNGLATENDDSMGLHVSLGENVDDVDKRTEPDSNNHEEESSRTLAENEKDEGLEKTTPGKDDELIVLEKVVPSQEEKSENGLAKNDEEEELQKEPLLEDESEILSYMSHFVEKLA